MARPSRLRLMLPALLACTVSATTWPADSLQASSIMAGGAAHVALGQSVVPLYGSWKFCVGDSPINPATNMPLWAEPDFDDSGWGTVELTPEAKAVDPMYRWTRYVFQISSDKNDGRLLVVADVCGNRSMRPAPLAKSRMPRRLSTRRMTFPC